MSKLILPHKIFALAIVAHPDDESFLLSGTTMQFAEEGKSVGVICATHGEKGHDRLNRNLTEEQMAEIRSKELKTACDIIDCRGVEFFNYPDGGLDKVDFKQLVTDIAKKIDEYQPYLILTFGSEGISGHRDHIAIGKATLNAAKKAYHHTTEIWLASIPVSCIESFNEHLARRKIHHSHFKEEKLQGVPDEKLLKIDIRKYAEKKHQALKAHASQYSDGLVWDHFLKQECFEVLK